ncbi:hypothetical protein V1389_10980 [Flavobacterium rakeshii]|uniref:hypothetical protein n=1 Tax=Flavobacterium rakeshii TaxID=1038845 RepID=UPI002E7BE173|nr:hypothetical protein [Flavobacterium rakeshii]MEE1898864.1 hypothetical protein [Flavobacterium rakeshii]
MKGIQGIAPFFVSGLRFGFPDITLQIILIISFYMAVSFSGDYVFFQSSGFTYSFLVVLLSTLCFGNISPQKINISHLSNTGL